MLFLITPTKSRFWSRRDFAREHVAKGWRSFNSISLPYSRLRTESPARRWLGSVGFAALAAAGVAPNVSRAQTVEDYFTRNNNVSVLERPHPEFAPLGVEIGAFHVEPTAGVTAAYADNIFATTTDEKGNLITALSGRVTTKSAGARSEISADAGVTSSFYSSFSSQNTTNVNLDASGRYDLAGYSNVTASVGYVHGALARALDTTITSASSPIQYDQIQATAASVQTVTRLQFSETLKYSTVQYANNETFGGAPLNLNYLNGQILSAGGRADYAINPDQSVFARVTGNSHMAPSEAVVGSRSSAGYVVGIGTDFDISRLTRGSIEIGYLDQYYTSAAYHTVGGVYAHGKVEYFPSALLTLTYRVDRQVYDAVDPVAVSAIETSNSLEADYELFPQMILTSQGSYETAKFTGEQRLDKFSTFSFGGTYLIGNHVGVRLNYLFSDRQSFGAFRVNSFTANTISLGLMFAL